MPRQKIDQEIPSISTPWNGYIGSRVEEFIKKTFGQKTGYVKVVTGSDGTSNVMAAFADEDAYNEWRALSDEDRWGNAGAAYLITYDTLPDIEQSDVYTVTLSLRETPQTIQPSVNVSVDVKAASIVKYASGGEEPVQEDVQIEIQTRTSTTAAYVTRATVVIPANSLNYTTINLASLLYAGTNYVRMRAVGEYATSIWRSFTLNVVALQLTPNTAFEVPMTAGSPLSLNYLVGGAIAKTLQFELGTGTGTDFEAIYSYLNSDPGCSRALGTATNLSTGMSFEFTDATMLAALMTSGVHTVRARLYVSETVKTEWVESQYMVAGGVSPFVAVNAVNPVLDNWTDVSFFKYCAYSAGAGSVGIRFRLVDSASDEVLASWSATAQDNVMYELTTQLGIELVDPTVTTFYGYMHIEDANGNDLADPVFFTFNNSDEFNPTIGADLVIAPANRSNSEANPKTVINTVSGQTVPSTWEGFGMVSDGWMDVNRDVDSTAANAETIRALHIPAGRKLTVQYNPFSEFMDGNNTGKHVTLEIDFRTNNILDDEEAIVKMCSVFSTDERAWGFEMLPKEAYLLTQRKRAVDDQNVTWAEGVRTHLAVNVVYGLNGLNYVRIFINGIIEREFNYAANDIFVGSAISMIFGNTKSDIDIFGIRCYKKALATEEVMKDYKSSLGTVSEKLAFAAANDILGDNGAISFTKALEKYNVIGHTGHLPKYGDENKGKTNGVSLLIHIKDDPDHSGTLTNLTGSGQGTTAMTYYDWNQQYKTNDDSVFTDENGTVHTAGEGYQLQAGEAYAKKIVGKINFASSMQGHKMGLTRAFNDLFKQLVSTGVIDQPSQITRQPSARIAVYEKPFLFFQRDTENDPWTFRYLMTFGAGKGDKPTFGFNKTATPSYMMVEGANNDRPLALFRIPWNEDITYDAGEEAWMYNGQKQINFGFGKTDSNEVPNDANAIAAVKAFFNFAYLHHQRIRYFAGTLTQLRASEDVDRSLMYWITTADSGLGAAQYDLFRYDEITDNWVAAGVTKTGAGQYETLNLRTQYEAFGGSATWTAGQWESINNMAIAQRTAHFKATASSVMHVDDALYHSCFVKFFAGTDNRAKNTYYYVDYLTMKIRFEQDDLDTVIKTNNVGQNRKPYYVEEHDTNASGEFYWQGEESGLYNLLETAFEDEMSAMMANMLGAMATLGGSVMDYLNSVVLQAQQYFPAIAYNEQARLVYEVAAVAQAAGTYVNTSVQAITQSCGSQRWSEYDWLRDRAMYISSWCEFGEFAGSSAAANGLSWRGKNGAVYNFVLTPAKWLYPRVGSDSGNYPASQSGKRVRVQAGQSINYPAITLSSDSWISIRGINYYVDLGDMNVGVSADQGTFAFYGKLLQKIEINPNGTDTNQLLANAIAIANATNIHTMKIRGVNTIVSELDLSECSRLESIDLRGSSFPIVELPASERLTTIKFPDTLTTLRMDAQPNLESVTFEGVQHLSTILVDQAKTGAFDTGLLATGIWEAKVQSGGLLASASFLNIAWTGIRADMLVWYASSSVVQMTGSVALLSAASDRYLTFTEVQALIDRFGNIQSQSNTLYIDYPKRTITSFNVRGVKYINTTGTFSGWSLNILPSAGNNVAIANNREAVHWEFVGDNAALAATYATITDAVRGTLNVIRLSDPALDLRFTIRVTMTLVDNTVITYDKSVGFYRRIPRVGDFAYKDGSFDDEFDLSKELVGAVFRREAIMTNNVLTGYKLMVYAKENAAARSTDGTLNSASLAWGLYADNTSANGFPTTLLTEVATAAGLASANDTEMPNITTSGIKNAEGTSTDYRYIRDSFLDSTKDDGYAVPAAGGCAADFANKSKNDIIINHANAIITRYLMEQYPNVEAIKVPTTSTELADALLAIVAQNASATAPARYRQFYFPAAYLCRMYQPTLEDDSDLDDQYKRGKWMLPAAGDLCRIYNFFYNSCNRVTLENGGSVSVEYADENPESEALTPLFANLLKRIRAVTAATSPFAMPTGSGYWSSTEYYATNAWNVYFVNGSVSSTYHKYRGGVARAVAEFIFNL